MTFISIIILVFTCFLVMIVLFFTRRNKQLKQLHVQELYLIKKSILINKKQISKRDKGLCGYNFLKFNLSESLIVQSEINLF